MLFIDGSWIPAASGQKFQSRNPATGLVLGEVADGGVEDARTAIESAREAFTEWSRLTAHQRSAYLRRLAPDAGKARRAGPAHDRRAG